MSRTTATVATVATFLAITLAGCPKKSVTIYRKLSEPGAMKTCDANQRFRVETDGVSEAAARSAGEAQIRTSVTKSGGCGAFITNDGAGSKLDGGFHYAADYQLCTCQ
ncbi:MAG: hypothetical protein NT062_30050 [Proteobacteria bacterium]|nr:hypothetical protein [Pseudomonadota bacterium]